MCCRKHIRASDAAALAALHVHDPLIGDFRDSAALVALMDLVVTVDTAPAHLAGALGAPVWVLLQHGADFRWLRGRRDSPWYPTARLFGEVRYRQLEFGTTSGERSSRGAAPDPARLRDSHISLCCSDDEACGHRLYRCAIRHVRWTRDFRTGLGCVDEIPDMRF